MKKCSISVLVLFLLVIGLLAFGLGRFTRGCRGMSRQASASVHTTPASQEAPHIASATTGLEPFLPNDKFVLEKVSGRGIATVKVVTEGTWKIDSFREVGILYQRPTPEGEMSFDKMILPIHLMGECRVGSPVRLVAVVSEQLWSSGHKTKNTIGLEAHPAPAPVEELAGLPIPSSHE